MSHIEALEEVIKYQKEKIGILEKEISELKLKAASPQIEQTAYLEKQKNCQHEYAQMSQSGGLSGYLLASTCTKCGYYRSTSQINSQPFIGGGSNQYSGPLLTSGYADFQPVNQQNRQIIPESERNRG